MALHRQGSGSWQVGIASFGTAFRAQDHGNGDQKLSVGGRQGNNSRYVETFNRTAMKSNRGKRLARTARFRPCGIGLFVFLLLCVVLITILGGDYLFSVGRNHKGGHGSIRSHDFFDNPDHSIFFSLWNLGIGSNGSNSKDNSNWGGDSDNGNWNGHDKSARALHFGNGFVGREELLDRDSRDWDKDDRIRDRYVDYETEDFQLSDQGIGNTNTGKDAELESESDLRANIQDTSAETKKDWKSDVKANAAKKFDDLDSVKRRSEIGGNQGDTIKVPSRSGGLYNERGRKELRMYEEQFEADLKQELDSSKKQHALEFESRHWHKRDEFDGNTVYDKLEDEANGSAKKENQSNMTETSRNEKVFDEEIGDDEYDDGDDEDEGLDEFGFDVEDEYLSTKPENETMPDLLNDRLGFSQQQKEIEDSLMHRSMNGPLKEKHTKEALNKKYAQDAVNKGKPQSLQKRRTVRRSRRSRRRRRAGFPCEIDFRNSTRGLREPEDNFKFANFSLKYIESEDPPEATDWEPRFAGHQTLHEREESFIARDQTIHCGFVKGPGSSQTSGFDMAEEDTRFLNTCKIAVSSCIFGSSDNIRSPRGKKLTGSFKKDVCFVMFVDERTLDVMNQEGQALDEKGYVGLWKVIVVRNLPYTDARRIGKIPKFLTHRLFPAARYSIWLDSKLRLQSDPVLILEHFLWRGGYEYAISNHYDRHCVWEEVQQNKKLNKFNHSVIDEQFAFYQADGLIRFNASDPNKLLPSHVPEGSFIVRAHTPMSNLFSCLWFNEVDRFTPRDQLSFAYTYMKLVRTNPENHFHLNMFKDCERKTMAKLFRHRRNVSSVVQGQELH